MATNMTLKLKINKMLSTGADDQIRHFTNFQEQYFESIMVRTPLKYLQFLLVPTVLLRPLLRTTADKL